MAVGLRGQLGQRFPPPVAAGFAPHGQFELGFAVGPVQNAGSPKEPPAERVQIAFLQLAQSPLQRYVQVVSRDGQATRREVNSRFGEV